MECKELMEPLRNPECSGGKPWNSLGFPSTPSGQAQPRPLAPWVFRSCCPAGFLAWGAKRGCPGGCLGVGKGWLRPELSQVPMMGWFLRKSMSEILCPESGLLWLQVELCGKRTEYCGFVLPSTLSTKNQYVLFLHHSQSRSSVPQTTKNQYFLSPGQ